MNLLNIAVGLYLILSGMFLVLSDTLFFTSIAVIVVVPILVARQMKGYKEAMMARRAIAKDKPKLIWISLFVILVIPFIISYAVHDQLGLAYNNVGFVYIGLSSWLNVLVNSFMLPRYKAYIGGTFD